jgi:c-di-GMP-binding flagellar brake protein YcgR
MMLGDISLGSHVSLEVERQGIIYKLTSKIFDSAEKEIVIAPPQLDGNNFRLLERDKIVILAKVDAFLFRWECDMWHHVTEGVVSTICLKGSEKGERYNRRNAFRVPIDVDTEATNVDTNQTFPISLRNISYLGVGFTSFEDLNGKELVSFTIMDEEWKFPLTVNIVRKEQPKVSGYPFYYGATISVSNRDISKYIAYKQREMVRKNRLGK